MKLAFLSRYQNRIERGAEIFIKELSKRLSKSHTVDVLEGKDADSISKVLSRNYDIVMPVNGRLQSLRASLLRIIGGYKLLITGHSGKGWDDIWNIAVVKPDMFIALTEDSVRWAKKWAWGTTVLKIPNGIDLDKFNPIGERININLQRPIILSVGTLVWYKRHERVIEAVSRLDKGSVLIVGEGPLEEELKIKGEEKLGHRFMISSFKNEDMPKLYRSVDLFSLPSWDREAFGIVYLEAMASGLGIVAPNDSARNEIIGEAGILVDVSDPKKYALAIEQALEKDWKEKAINQAKKFSWDKIAREYEKVFRNL